LKQGARFGQPDNRVEHEAADRNLQRREPPDEPHGSWRHTDLLTRLAECRRFDRFVGIDAPARQCDLTRVLAQTGAAHGEEDVGDVRNRVYEHECGGVAQPWRWMLRIPADARLWRHAQLRRETREWRAQCTSKSSFEIDHVTIVSLDSVRTHRTRSRWDGGRIHHALTCCLLCFPRRPVRACGMQRNETECRTSHAGAA
jgi:hypothetical protein